jgi:hypothetical protein
MHIAQSQSAEHPAAKRGPRPLITVAVGILLVLFMAAELIFGFRIATQTHSDIQALPAAALLQAYPEEIGQRLSTLRDQLEAHSYEAQALANLKNAVARFNQDLEKLYKGPARDLPELSQALSLWTQFSPMINPVIDFSGSPYLADNANGVALSSEGLTHYHAVKQAQLFTNDNAKLLQISLSRIVTALQRASSSGANDLRLLLMIGMFGTFVLTLVATWLARKGAAPEHPAAAPSHA